MATSFVTGSLRNGLEASEDPSSGHGWKAPRTLPPDPRITLLVATIYTPSP